MVKCNLNYLKGHEQLLEVIDLANTKADIQSNMQHRLR